jgi:hypothetical protein
MKLIIDASADATCYNRNANTSTYYTTIKKVSRMPIFQSVKDAIMVVSGKKGQSKGWELKQFLLFRLFDFATSAQAVRIFNRWPTAFMWIATRISSPAASPPPRLLSYGYDIVGSSTADSRCSTVPVYRTLDGGNNSFRCPWAGQGGVAYARGVVGFHIPTQKLPDAQLVFDLLFKRTTFKPSVCRMNSLIFDLASLVTHDIIATDGVKNKNSSYADLQPLYGNSVQEASIVRVYAKGMLNDMPIPAPRPIDAKTYAAFAGKRAWLEIFRREHNRIAAEIVDLYPERFLHNHTPEQQDESIYQIARLITCGMYGKIVVEPYVSSLVGCFAGFSSMLKASYKRSPATSGNHLSYEFKLLYHWHAALPDQFMVNPEETSLEEVLIDRSHRLSGQLGARNIPQELARAEVATINKSRAIGIATFNEVRSFIGLPICKTFEDINSDPEVATALRKLYQSPDDVDLYVGAMIEQKFRTDGQGAAFGMTIGAVVLLDAIKLIGRDSFFTHNLSPSVYTPYGYNLVMNSSVNDVLERNTDLCMRTGDHPFSDVFRVPRSVTEGLVYKKRI